MRAFPANPMNNEQWHGMELRDYFASHANMDDMSVYYLTELNTDELTLEQRLLAIAILRYKYADAMMKARSE